MALQDFTLLAKLEDFDLYTHNVCQKFQKSERHVLSASIRGNVEEIVCLVIEAAKVQLEERRKKDLQQKRWNSSKERIYVSNT